MEPIELTPVRDTLHLAPSIAPKIALPTLTDLTTKIPTPAELLQGINTPQEKVEKDPYKLAEEAYFKKKKPKIDTSSSIAPTETITPEEYKGFNKDDTISSSVKYDPNYEANKRATQTLGERFANTAQKFGANATSTFLGGLSTIPNILGSLTNGIGYLAGNEQPISEYFNLAPDSGVMKDLFEWSDAVNKDNRNYQSNWSKENWIQDMIPFWGDGGFQDIVTSAGYTAGAIGEALVSGGIASILSKGTKLAGMGAKLSKYLNDPVKIDKVLSAISATAKNAKSAQLIGEGGYLIGRGIGEVPSLYRMYVGAHTEAAFEGLEGAKRFEEDVVAEYKRNHGGISPSEGELAKIKDLAQNVGDLRYKLNLLTLTIPNYIQMGALLKTFPGASKVAKTLLGKNELGSVQLGDELGTFKVNAINDIKFNTTNALWDKRIPKAFKNGVEKTLSYGQKFGKIPLSVSEGLEEEMQYFIDEHTTSLYKGAYLNEKGLEENSLYLSGLWDTIQNKLATKEATQAFLMGSMGGGIQQSMNTVYETVFDKNKLKEKIAQNELYAKKLEDISGSLFKSSDVFNVATDEERVQLENYLSKALDQNSLNGTLQENYQKVLASLNTNAATNVAIQKNFLGAQRIYQDLQDRDVSGLLHSVVSSGKQEVFKEHLNSIANATEEEIQNLYGININEQTRDNKQFAKNLIDKLNKIEGYSKKISFAFNDTFDNETDNQFYSMYKQQLSHNLYMMNRKQERIGELSTPNSALFLDLLQDKKQSINDKIEELKTATSLVPIKDATKRIALLEQLKDGSNVSLKDAIYAYSGESVAELEAVAEFEKANDALILKEGRSGIDNLRKYYEELYSTDGFELFKDQHKDYYDAIKAVREFQQKSADRKVRNEKQYTQLQKDLLVKDDGENIKKAVQKLSEDISNVEDDEKLTKEQKESKKQFLINEAKQKIANLRNSKPVETVEKKTPKTETTKETEVVETPAVEVKDVVVEEITTDVAQKFSEAPIVKQATKKETKTNLSSFLAILRNKKLDEITKAEDWIDSKGLSVFQEKRKEYFKKRSSYNSDLKGFLGELETARAIELHKDTAHKNSFFSFYKDKSSISKNSIEMYGETRAEIELALAVDEIVELYKKLNETTKEEDLKDVSIDDFDEEVPAVSNDLQSKIKEVRLAIKKAGQGEGGQFFVTLTDGTKLGAVRLGVVGDTLQTSDGEIDFSIITKIENPDGTVLYDSNPSPLIDEKTVERKIQLELKDAKSLEVNQIDFNANILSINAEQQQRISESERNNYTAHFLGSVVGKVQTVKRFVEAEKAGKTIPKGFDSWNKRAKETLEEANRTYKTLIESYIKKDMHTEDELIKEIGVLLKGKNVNQRNVAPVVVDVKADIERRRQEELEKKVQILKDKRNALRGEDGVVPKENIAEWQQLGKDVIEAQNKATRGNNEGFIPIRTEKDGVLSGEDAINAENEIERVIQKIIKGEITIEQAVSFIHNKYKVLANENGFLLNYINDRTSNAPEIGNNKQSFPAWRKGKYDAELAALESPQQSNEESKKADIERRRKEELTKIIQSIFPNTQLNEIVYHGTRTQDKFDTFDENKIGELDSGYFGRGFYFSPDKSYAEGYSKQYNGYTIAAILNLQNPLETDANKANTNISLENNDGAIVRVGENLSPELNTTEYDSNEIGEVVAKNSNQIYILSEKELNNIDKINAKYDEELAALETPVVNLPFDNTNLLGALSTENTIPEILLTEAQGLKILQPEYYLALDVLDRDEAKANLQRRKELLNSVTNLSEIPTTVREVAYPAKSINKTEQIYGDVFIKLGGGKLYHLIHTNPETGQETILYEFRSLKHGFGLQKTWVDTSYPRIVEELKNTDGLLETTGKDGFTNKPFFFGDFSSYYSLYDVWNLMNEDERSDFLHKFNIRADQMQEAFDTQNVFEKLLASPSEKYELNRILDGWVDAHRGTEVSSYAVDFKTQTTIDTLPQSKFIDAETGNQHHVVVYADFDLLYDGEGNLKTETEYKIAKQKVVDGMQVRVDAGNNTSRITNYILDNLIQQLDSEVLEPVHFLSSGYNLVLSDTNGKPYIKSLFPSTDLKGNEVLNKNLHALVESADWNGKSTREAGFHILLNNLSNKVGYSVEVSNVKFNFYTKQDGKQVRSIAVSLEWVDKDTKKSKTLHISLKENLTEEGRYEKNIKEISDGLIKQVEKEFGVTGISAKFVAAEAKEPVDVPTILKNNNSVELGVFWNRNDFRKDTPVLFNSDRVIPRIVEEYEQELKEESSVALPVVSTKIEEAKTKTAAPIEQSDIPPIQAMVNKHVGEKGMILQKDENITSEKALLFGADVVKIMEQSKDAEQMLNEMLEDSKTISENETHSDIKSILSLLYFNPKFESLRPYFNTQPKPIDSNCVLTQN